ncbi:Prephenate dehydratase [Candidatus Gugararchaeum adminiculabundum]|nr:Prephenate dehydratase [Candidatus Gugararchaeum adminiculabundum]
MAESEADGERKIEILRKRIDELDSHVVMLLDERARIAKKIGKVKAKINKDVHERGREKAVIENVKRAAKVINPDEVEHIYREIISACRAAQQPTKVAFLGPLGTFSDAAANEYFGGSKIDVKCNSFADVFKSVETGLADYGVVPLENSGEGSIGATIDALVKTQLKIVGEIELKVIHNLLTLTDTNPNSIKKIYGHPQALAQSKMFLSRMKAQKIPVQSTAKACELLDSKSAAVASLLAAKIYGLKVQKRGIQDSMNNVTRFIVLGKNDSPNPTDHDKTSLLFSLRHEPGALYATLKAFASRRINLTKIESRPSRQQNWDYLFFVDLEGHRTDKVVQEALKVMEKKAKFMKILGSYPRA